MRTSIKPAVMGRKAGSPIRRRPQAKRLADVEAPLLSNFVRPATLSVAA
jgi:hypothetical protein